MITLMSVDWPDPLAPAEAGPFRFEQADAKHHDHLIDLDTGQVVEFDSERIEAQQAEIAENLGYDILHHRLELCGRKRR